MRSCPTRSDWHVCRHNSAENSNIVAHFQYQKCATKFNCRTHTSYTTSHRYPRKERICVGQFFSIPKIDSTIFGARRRYNSHFLHFSIILCNTNMLRKNSCHNLLPKSDTARLAAEVAGSSSRSNCEHNLML